MLLKTLTVKKLKLAAALGLPLVVVTSLMWLGWLEWPGLHWDADYFSSVIINVAQNDKWIFDSYSPFLLDRASNNYDSHGVLQVWFFAKLLLAKDWQSLTIAMAAVNSASYILWMWLFQYCLRKHGCALPWLNAGWLAVVPAVICLGLQGRPEQLAPLLLAFPAAGAQLRWRAYQQRVCVGLTLGALFLLSPLVGLIAFLGYLTWVASNSRESWQQTAIGLLIVGVLMFIVSFLGLKLISPLEFFPWLQNLRSGGTPVPFAWLIRNQQSLIWGTTLVSPFWILIISSAIFIVLLRMISRRQLLLFFGTIAALGWVISRGLDYSYIPFLPLVMLLWIDEQLIVPQQQTLKKLCLQTLPQIFSFIYVLIIVQQTLYSFVVVNENATPAQARRILAPYYGLGDLDAPTTLATTIATGRAGVVLAPVHSPTISLPSSQSSEEGSKFLLNRFEKHFKQNVQFFVLQQSHNVIYNPPPKRIYLDSDQPFVLVKDGWKRKFSFFESRLRPARLGNAYWLAVYKRVNPLPQKQTGNHEREEAKSKSNNKSR